MSQTKQERNKALVLEAFDALFNKRDYVAAERYWSPRYVQHSAHIAPGREGLLELVKAAPPTLKDEAGMVVAEGDYVILHGRFSGFGLPVNWIVADILRIEDGVLAEHWDVIQDEATEEQSKSKAPMFGSSFAESVRPAAPAPTTDQPAAPAPTPDASQQPAIDDAPLPEPPIPPATPPGASAQPAQAAPEASQTPAPTPVSVASSMPGPWSPSYFGHLALLESSGDPNAKNKRVKMMAMVIGRITIKRRWARSRFSNCPPQST